MVFSKLDGRRMNNVENAIIKSTDCIFEGENMCDFEEESLT